MFKIVYLRYLVLISLLGAIQLSRVIAEDAYPCHEIKAAFIYNFAKFHEGKDKDRYIHLCIARKKHSYKAKASNAHTVYMSLTRVIIFLRDRFRQQKDGLPRIDNE